MSGSVTADVAVVGLGAFGAAVLCRLASRRIKAIGIDRFDPPHTMGSSHGETRITRLAVGEGDAYAPVVRRSHELWRELEAQTGRTLMSQTGGLIMAPRGGAARHHGREDFVERSFTMAARFGIPHERLEADEIARRFPQFQLRGDELGYFEPTGGVLAPEACVATQLQLARKWGATIRVNERVIDVAQQGEGVRITTDRGVVHAGRAVLTVGPWLAKLMPPKLQALVRPYRQMLHWFEPHDAGDFAIGRFPVFIWIHGEREEDYFYGFPMPPGAIGIKVATESYEKDTDPDRVERTISAEESAAMYADHVHNRLRGVSDRVVTAAACLYTVTPDSGFVIDALPEQNRITVISACSGHGFKHSAAIGEAVAQKIADGRSTIDLASFKLNRFKATIGSWFPRIDRATAISRCHGRMQSRWPRRRDG